MSDPPITALVRSLPSWADAVTSLLTFGVVGGICARVAERKGVPHHWAFALGYIVGSAVIIGRHALIAKVDLRPHRWRTFAFQVGLTIAATVLIAALWGARIFALAA